MSVSSFYEKYFPFWERLSEADRALLCESTASERYESDQAVHNSTECSGLFIVRSGRLRIYMLSETGKEITLYRLSAGDLCMLSASCVLQSITFDVYVDAELPTECYRIAGGVFAEIVERYPDVKIFALDLAVQRFSEVMWVMQQLLFMRQDQRLAIFLLEEAQSVGGDAVSITHEKIARHLGTAREVVTRMLRHLAADGMIEVSRGGIVIKDKARLRSVAYAV